MSKEIATLVDFDGNIIEDKLCVQPSTEEDAAAHGLMCPSDKAKLDTIEVGAQVNYISEILVEDNKMTINTSDDKSLMVPKLTEDNKIAPVLIDNATTSKAGLMSIEDKEKLSKVDENANNYIHPEHTVYNTGLYKIKVDNEGHICEAIGVTKEDISDIGVSVDPHPLTHEPSIIVQDENNRFVSDKQIVEWSSKASTSTATNTSAGLMSAEDKKNLDDLLKNKNNIAVDDALSTTSTNPVQNKVVTEAINDHGVHVTFSDSIPSQHGTAATGTATTVSRSDHVHPKQTTISGNAGSATKLETPREIKVNLGSTTAANFDGTGNINPGVSGTLSIANGGTGATTESDARKNLGISYSTSIPTSAPSTGTGSVCFVEDIHASLPITEGGTGATSVSAARANLKLNHVGASASAKGSISSISLTPASEIITIPLTDFISISDTNFQIIENGIECPYDGQVLISGNVYIENSSVAQKGCYLFKNGGELISQYIQAGTGVVSSGTALIDVSAGDIITIAARCGIVCNASPNNKSTQLTVSYVN